MAARKRDESAPREVVVQRTFAAPRARVFEAWTQPEHAVRWYGPRGATVPVCELDARPGGAFRVCMRMPDGAECWEEGVFQEFVAGQRLVLAYAVRVGEAAVNLTTTVTFEDRGAYTRVTVRQSYHDDDFTRGARAGTEQSFDRLAVFLARTQSEASCEIIAARVFDAPRELVFDVWTNPEHVSHWWGPDGFTTTTLEWDLRPGGTWRFVMHGPDGTDYANRIVFTEVVRPQRLKYDHYGDEEVAEVRFRAVVEFTELGAQTELILRMTFATPEERNHVVEKYGAVEGAVQMLERLVKQLRVSPAA